MTHQRLPQIAFRAAQVRQGEQAAARQLGWPMYQLMESAGTAVYEHLRSTYPTVRHLLVCCGGGNNGGDGYIVARLARLHGLRVTLWQLGDAARLQGDAATARDAWLACGGIIQSPQTMIPAETEVIVDALLGTGLSGAVRPDAAALIGTINVTGKPVVAVDIPSGLCADTGRCLGETVQAHQTVTLIGVKRGLLTGQAAQYRGELIFAGLGAETALKQAVQSEVSIIQSSEIQDLLPPRARTAHKGSNGRVLCVGGNQGMGGAIRLASEASARSGAGLTAATTHADNVLAILTARPEIMAQSWQQDSDESGRILSERMRWANVIVMGPGLGQNAWGQALYCQLNTLSDEQALVLDADGLNLLARSPDYKKNRILTPHPGEAARLLNVSVAEVEADRFAAAELLQHRYGGVVVLKGAGTVVFDGHRHMVCLAGNPGMATGGMGDVLVGLIGGLLAQGLTLSQAARVGVWVHSRAADLAAEVGERGLLAGDLFAYIRQLINLR
ncbi:bifunctional ADP-dependent NAD(P)H-hydrate dehydratase/NAD(P)H-hydrate epimerase [Photobacterium galatheae]|uniref:Bifunctional NAD(P)H-hydrate repair enzyme n=1 Tax=Photobacterium galatheae TaxID=1654360 RepID=A0A066RIY6_9GAMM|nr:bifunctional ADP-dependent NAD(P)H-hydrate dehydratase/NAD(P)H-hydrate epimerase [Photobacterium galatheae]KDM90284.1 NAD(P)H-hydrate epimerase [Photobacterium galatheae]MCM0150834.1 bifunctional ADP-dependent NAD(P)H-hydrate dehydratase/NAD(P)H-hydrate epimerase [Photobacterium galatheae]